MSFEEFLNNKPLFYDKIDLERMPEAYGYVENSLGNYRIVHIVGTNGKGSTGRILAELLRREGFSVGHYTSPHILRFNERIWIDGSDISDEALQESHEKLMGWLSKETADALSYFEYTTLLALVAFEKCDIVVLEAGLGGEFDATSVTKRELSVITPIGFDHQAFLGETIEEIAGTKLRCMAKDVVISPQPYDETLQIARNIAKERGSTLYFPSKLLSETLIEEIEEYSKRKGWPFFISENAATAFASAKILTGKVPDPSSLESVKLKGRFERIAPNVILDVGHNPLAARAVAAALDLKRPVLVYNAFEDKDVDEVLKILAPFVERVEIIEVENQRVMAPERLKKAIESAGLQSGEFEGVKEEEEYLVFGSFAVAEAFLKRS